MHLGFSSMNTVHDPRPADLAKILEEAGFESLWYGEHSHIPMARKTPYPPGGELPEPYKEMTASTMASVLSTDLMKRKCAPWNWVSRAS